VYASLHKQIAFVLLASELAVHDLFHHAPHGRWYEFTLTSSRVTTTFVACVAFLVLISSRVTRRAASVLMPGCITGI
jgi:hypothetical protein